MDNKNMNNGNDKDTMKEQKTKNKKNNNGMETTILYFVSVVLLGLVISLAVKNYKLENEIKEIKSDRTAEAGQTELSDKTEMADETGTSDAEESEENTEAVAILTAQDGVEYKDISVLQTAKADDYNGDDLKDNGYPYAIKINRQENIVTIYSLDSAGYYTVPVKAMRCSVSPVGETPVGLFNIAYKWEWLALFDNCYGQYVSQIEGDTLFHSVPYLDTTKDSLETWEFNKLGTGASLGCVRLCVADTKWIYDNCDQGTYVDIFDSDYYGPLGRPEPVTKLQNTEEQGWDPTDMVEENPTTGKAVIYGAESHSIKLGENYDAMAGILAFSADRQDVTDQVKTEGTVDNKKAGKYTVKYSLTDSGKEITKDIIITVVDDEAPVITRLPVEIKVENYTGQNDDLAELIASYITAKDGDTVISGGVATDGSGHTMDGTAVSDIGENVICVALDKMDTAPGSYDVVCCAQDSSGNRSSYYNIKITVVK